MFLLHFQERLFTTVIIYDRIVKVSDKKLLIPALTHTILNLKYFLTPLSLVGCPNGCINSLFICLLMLSTFKQQSDSPYSFGRLFGKIRFLILLINPLCKYVFCNVYKLIILTFYFIKKFLS